LELGWSEWAAPRRAAGGGGGGGLVAVGDCERVEEHQWEARKLAAGDVGHEEGRRGELRGGLGRGGVNGGDGGSGHRERLGRAPGAGRRVEGEVEGSFAKQKERRRARQRRKRAGNWHTARLGAFVAVARRRPSSACVERPRGFGRPKTGRDEGTARGRQPGLGRRPRLGQHRTEEGEREERE